jgi:hypothetical protein
MLDEPYTITFRAMVRFYNKPVAAHRWVKEVKQVVKIAWLSCHPFWSNNLRLWLGAIATAWEICGGVCRCHRELAAGC